MWSSDRERAARAAAMEWLAARTHDGLNPLTSTEIGEFTFDGEPFRLMDPQRGIRKPAQFASALSIRTVWRSDETNLPYADHMGDDGLERYKWRGDDPDHPDNRALRTAVHADVPLIWFRGVGPAVYQPIYPIYLVGEEPAKQQFVVATDGQQHIRLGDSPLEEVMRRYLRSETVRRLHQPVFRSMVLQAYGNRCSVCELGHLELLDAAHIVEDKHERGIAAVRNGLALCKIHHAAYDARILGVRPDLIVQIRDDVLEEIDGPLLEHGLKGLHGHSLHVPRRHAARPDPERLQWRYDRFLEGLPPSA